MDFEAFLKDSGRMQPSKFIEKLEVFGSAVLGTAWCFFTKLLGLAVWKPKHIARRSLNTWDCT